MSLSLSGVRPAARDVFLSAEPTPAAPGRVRQALRNAGLDEDLEHTVTLLASEVVGNSVRHAGMRPDEKIVVYARLEPDHVRCEVGDTGLGFDPDRRDGVEGFGLRLLDKLASRWGVRTDARGTRVWFEVDQRPRRFKRAG